MLLLLSGGEVFFELRHGDALIEIPSGWVLESGPGALYFRALPNGIIHQVMISDISLSGNTRDGLQIEE